MICSNLGGSCCFFLWWCLVVEGGSDRKKVDKKVIWERKRALVNWLQNIHGGFNDGLVRS